MKKMELVDLVKGSSLKESEKEEIINGINELESNNTEVNEQKLVEILLKVFVIAEKIKCFFE